MAPPTSGKAAAAADKATARRLRKREQDRKAQAQARERKNNRIAHLEALVDQLTKDNAESDAPALMDRLSNVTKERDALLGALRTLESSIRRHIEQATEIRRALPAPAETAHHSDHSDSPAQSILAAEPSVPWDAADRLRHDVAWEMQPAALDPLSYPEAAVTPRNGLPDALVSRARSESSHNSSTADEDVIVPLPATQCYCVPFPNPNHTPGHTHAVNTWRAANEALGKAPVPLTPETAAAEDATAHDTPVRAILEGWDAAEAAGLMTESWRKLRQVDEVCFKNCGDVERLACLKTMHMLMTYHGDPTPERLGQLPPWFWMRPSQALAHSYAIDYFVWPGVRERFVFSQHRYCTNLFWQLFQDNFRITWQYGFRDCYMQDRVTGRFRLSPLFNQSLGDIGAWTMEESFFDTFPELRQDIPRPPGLTAPVGSARKDMEALWGEVRRRAAAGEDREDRAEGSSGVVVSPRAVASPLALLPSSGEVTWS